MNRKISIAPVRKTLTVQASPARAFEVFTLGIDRWWPKNHSTGSAPIRTSIIEPFVGGRWYAIGEDGAEGVVGHVLSWEINASWASDARAEFASEVEVRFIAESGGSTRVELEHRDFERMAEGGEKMRGQVDGGWPALLDLFVQELARSVEQVPVNQEA